jgi:isopenicillin N synthase-like dioxygenase
MADIPIVDFGAFLKDTQEEKEQVATQIDNAFRTAGFMYLKNHGVPRSMIEECFSWVSIPYSLRALFRSWLVG